MTCRLIFAAQSHRKEESTRNKHGDMGLAGTHQPTWPTLWGSDAHIPQGWGNNGTASIVAAFIINADAITDSNGSLGWRFSRVAGYRACGGVAPPAPCQTLSRWGATSSPIPDQRRPGNSQTQPFRRLHLLSRLGERLLNPDGHQRLLEDCKSQYYQGCNQLLLVTLLLNICSAFCH